MEALSKARSLLAEARRVTVLTGAGISAESGIPTFRDALTGLWSRFRPEELATPEAFERDPHTVWEWYAWRRSLVAQAQPNAGHAALASLEASVEVFTLVTQNVDGLHARAGSRNLIELHGNIQRDKCYREGRVLPPEGMKPGSPPTCARCGAPVRPDVVWFGEMLDPADLDRAFEAARQCDVFLSVGTSGLVEPAASLPLEALASGACMIEVNPQPTSLSRRATVCLAGRAGEILPLLAEARARTT
jgi:NAD-dependent deacetylase